MTIIGNRVLGLYTTSQQRVTNEEVIAFNVIQRSEDDESLDP